MMKYEIEFVESENGQKPFEEFVQRLPIKERAGVFETVNYFLELKNMGLPVKESLSKHLEDGIFELRSYLHDKTARILYFYQKGRKIILTHGFIKKTQKTPRKEIERAMTLRNEYERRTVYDKL